MKQADISQRAARGYKKALQITRHYAKTFYFASGLLPGYKKDAAYAIYAICRLSDQSVDDGLDSSILGGIGDSISKAYGPGELKDDLLCAFRNTINEYRIPKQYFDDLLKGMQMDLDINRYVNFNDLYVYCYRVAGVVGLIMLKVFGYSDPEAERYAKDLGIAMQLTNILRDIKEDYSRGRIYLPLDEMERFGVTEGHISGGLIDDNFINLFKFQIERARSYYANSERGITFIRDKRSRLATYLIKEAYSEILKKIELSGYDIFSKRLYVGSREKTILALKVLSKAVCR